MYQVLKPFTSVDSDGPFWAERNVYVEKLSPDDTLDIFDTRAKAEKDVENKEKKDKEKVNGKDKKDKWGRKTKNRRYKIIEI